MLSDNTLWNTSATSVRGTLRWQAPELFGLNVTDGDPVTVTKESDIYSYGMTCYLGLALQGFLTPLNTDIGDYD